MSSRQDWIDLARLVPIEGEIARRGIKLAGRGPNRSGPCPVCGGTDRFSINIAKRVFHCRRCQRGGDVIELVRHLDGCDFTAACETLTGSPAQRKPMGRVPDAPIPEDHDEQETTRRAQALWDEAVSLQGTLAELYLRNRGLVVWESANGRALRFHPQCPFGPATKHPCLVALFRSINTDQPVAIHRVALTAAGAKLGRMALGSIGGAAIKLTPEVDVTYGLTIGEGIETTLAGMMLGFSPAWALGSAGAIERFPVLAGIEALTILVDNDVNGAGPGAARVCSERWTKSGREVLRVVPRRIDDDINNIVLQGNAA